MIGEVDFYSWGSIDFCSLFSAAKLFQIPGCNRNFLQNCKLQIIPITQIISQTLVTYQMLCKNTDQNHRPEIAELVENGY